MYIYKLFIEYNGRNLFGSQKQRSDIDTKSSLRTVQGILEDILSKLLKSKFKLKLASRTDSGVHALCNIGKLVCNEVINREHFLATINYLLPDDIKIVDIVKTKDFNPYSAKYKVYWYIIYNSVYNKPTIFDDYCWYVPQKISFTKLRLVAKFISSQKKFDFATTKEYVEEKQIQNVRLTLVLVSYNGL